MKKNDVKKDIILCRDCINAYDYHELDYNHEPFLCRCPFFKWDRFLNRDTCENSKRKQP